MAGLLSPGHTSPCECRYKWKNAIDPIRRYSWLMEGLVSRDTIHRARCDAAGLRNSEPSSKAITYPLSYPAA